MCGNPRKYFGEKTIQEQKEAMDSLLDLIDDHFDNISDDELMYNLIEAGHNPDCEK
jgi:hypothetical protein